MVNSEKGPATNSNLMNSIGEALQVIQTNKFSHRGKHNAFYNRICSSIGEEIRELTQSAISSFEAGSPEVYEKIAKGLDSLRKTWETSFLLMITVEEYRNIADSKFFDRFFVSYVQMVEGKKPGTLATLCDVWSNYSTYDDVRDGKYTWLCDPALVPPAEWITTLDPRPSNIALN